MILQFAWRYFKGKKSTQAIQIISWVSVVAMAVGTAALIIVLSVFNGFDGFIKDLYSGFYPAFKISPIQTKTCKIDDEFIASIKQLKGVEQVSKTIEEKVMLSFNGSQVVTTLKGVDTLYEDVTSFRKSIRYGQLDFKKSAEIPPVILGIGISNRLGANEESHLPIECYAFKKGTTSMLDMASSYSTSLFEITGIYVLQEEIDNQYAFAPLQVVQDLIGKPDYISSLEIKMKQGENSDQLQEQIKHLPSAQNYKVESRYEQNKTLYFILKSERWIVFSLLTLMLIIASFNIVGSMSMLILDKEKDIAILKTMGMSNTTIKNIFISTAILLSLVGATIGCTIAFIICSIQQYFGVVKLGGEGSFLIEAYPVKMQISDFIIVLITVIIIAIFASLIPAIKAGKKAIELRSK